jgi:predicted AlkP superfamily pyrophosphatase or phosphodiesterase
MPALPFKKSLILYPVFILLLFAQCRSDRHKHTGEKQKQPKLVVGIVVDQMRYDFLYRYWDKYGKGGFKRLLKEGYSCANTNINYVPTYTAPGHAAIYTGTTPAVNGMVGNNWYSRKLNKSIYCVSDSTTEPVGSANKKEGRMSPRNLVTNTITDQLRLSDNMNSKTIGISLKDRGSILPAGHSASGAYWYDGIAGAWITSNYYMDSLPDWVRKFNSEKQPVKFLNQKWETYYPINTYTESTRDNTDFEEPFKGETTPVFPYDLWRISGNGYELLRETPFGNTYTKNFAEAAIKGEKMGKGDFTDFLAMSFSSTDYVGHRFGPNSVETEDTYIRLDKDIEEFLDFLDSYLGKENVLVFLTADHGAANNPNYLKSKGIREPGGFFDQNRLKDSLNGFLKKTYHHDSLVADYENQQIYLDYDKLNDAYISVKDISLKISDFVKNFPGVASAIPAYSLEENNYPAGKFHLVQQGFMPSRSGDVAISLQPGWIEYKQKGTTHGSGNSYDTHIPLLFYGWKIKPGISYAEVSVTDIAPTLAALLQIQEPSGCTGKPILQLMP